MLSEASGGLGYLSRTAMDSPKLLKSIMPKIEEVVKSQICECGRMNHSLSPKLGTRLAFVA